MAYDYPPVFEWPSFFDDIHWMAVAVMVLLLVDAIVITVRDASDASPEAPR